MARKIQVEIIGDASSLERAFGKAGKSSSTFGQKMGRLAKGGGLALAAGAVATLKIGFDELAESQKVGAQTSAVLESTGKAAKVSKREVEGLASALSRMSGVDDEAIQSGQNLLLTFTRIRNEVGKGNDIFNQATKATLDMSVAMGTDMRGASILVGKALNDPIKGVAALGRAGVQFTSEQKETIKTLVESGRTMEAQKMILKELETQFGGSAKAAGETLPGQLAKARNAFEEVAGKLAEKLLPVVVKVLQGLLRFVEWAEVHVPRIVAGISNFVSAAVAKFVAFRDGVVGVFNAVKSGVQSAISFALGLVSKFLGGMSVMLHFMGKLPGPLGAPFRAAADAVDNARAKVDGLDRSIRGLPTKKTITITTIFTTVNRTVSEVGAAVAKAGRRAAGGPVSGGSAYVVGEQGPELFVPGRSGTIIPNGGGAAGNRPIHVHVHVGEREVAEAIFDPLRALNTSRSRIGKGLTPA